MRSGWAFSRQLNGSFLRLIPGDAITASLGIESGTLTPAQRAALNHYYGTDKPVPEQFVSWVGQLLHGNLGVSLSSGVPVSHLLATALPVTIELAVLAALIGTAVGVTLGTLAGSKPGGARDSVTQTVGLLGLARSSLKYHPEPECAAVPPSARFALGHPQNDDICELALAL
jgi:ABC-type dipeptide/oligopeptide/nickel transport system permease component